MGQLNTGSEAWSSKDMGGNTSMIQLATWTNNEGRDILCRIKNVMGTTGAARLTGDNETKNIANTYKRANDAILMEVTGHNLNNGDVVLIGGQAVSAELNAYEYQIRTLAALGYFQLVGVDGAIYAGAPTGGTITFLPSFLVGVKTDDGLGAQAFTDIRVLHKEIKSQRRLIYEPENVFFVADGTDIEVWGRSGDAGDSAVGGNFYVYDAQGDVDVISVAGATPQSDIATETKQDIIDTNIDQIETAVITNAAGVDIAADIIAVKAETANILTDTGTTLPASIAAIPTVGGAPNAE